MRVHLREQSSAEYAISLTSWLLGPNAVLKQLEAVEEDQKDESVKDEFEDCQVDQLEVEEEDNKDEDMNRNGLVAFVKDSDDDEQVDTDVDDPNYTPPAEKTDTEDDFSEEEDEGNESDADEDDQVKQVNDMKMQKEEVGSSSEEENDEEEEKKENMKRSIFAKKRSLPLGQSSESDLKKRKSSFDTDEDDMEEGEGHKEDGLKYPLLDNTGKPREQEYQEKVHFEEEEEVTGTQKSILDAAEEGLYDDLEDEEMYEEEDFKIGRQDQRFSKGNVAEDDSSYQSDAEEEEEVCSIFNITINNINHILLTGIITFRRRIGASKLV